MIFHFFSVFDLLFFNYLDVVLQFYTSSFLPTTKENCSVGEDEQMEVSI